MNGGRPADVQAEESGPQAARRNEARPPHRHSYATGRETRRAKCLGRLAMPPVRILLAACVLAAAVAGCSCEGPEARITADAEGIPLVRVKLGEDTGVVYVTIEGPYRVRDAGREVASGRGLADRRVAAAGGQLVLGDAPVGAGPLDIHPAPEGRFRIRQTVDGRERTRVYRGFLRLLPTRDGRLRAVNVLNVEVYLAGLLRCELFPSWHVETYKAQAVAARTYALAAVKRAGGRDFDVYDSIMSQAYGGCEMETETAWAAVVATRGVVGTYEDAGSRTRLLSMYYHSTCGGATVAAGDYFGGSTPPPLAGVPCTFCQASRLYRWDDVELLKAEMTEALRATGEEAFRDFGPIVGLEVAETTSRGGAKTIRVWDRRKAVRMSARAWRLAVGPAKVPSTWFQIQDAGERVVLQGRGFGHGVGMCQYGAEYLARHGRTGEQILRHYYPGIVLARAY